MDPNAALTRIRELMNVIDRAATDAEAECAAVDNPGFYSNARW